MTAKKINELTAKTPISTDVLPVADPSTGIAGKSTTAQVLVAGFNQASTIVTGSSLCQTSATVAIASAQHNLQLGIGGFHRLNVTSVSDLTGIAPPGVESHKDGRTIRLVNVGSAALSVKNEDANSTASNRIITSGGNLNLQVYHMLECIYDGTASRWRVWMQT